ncbi:MAG: electron transfer flavoprotein subunit beta/FixA family protein [Candidatus Muirbacterium halophilum]|nr:electron transfer flavoprotein subunit beta/FixA family protein [Candidatus Muirbacterium halophilum]MCK9475333.1 electron transfer flavoprotein subunit beta/FixA family protein [Candidatus Muirbacterium halophilum]
MKIIVTVKQVPNTNEVKWDRSRGTLKREGVDSIINPEDKYALETALQLKEKKGAEVIVITMGPPQAEEALREVFAMGADRAILLSDRAFAGADTLATSYALAAAIKKIGDYDYIFAGRQAIDGDTAQVGPQIAGFLDIPQITYVKHIEVTKDGLKIKKETDFGYQIIEAKKPVLLTFIDSNEPRYPSVKGIYEAFEKNIEIMTNAELELKPSRLGLEGSPTKVKKVFKPSPKGKGEIVDCGTPRELAATIVDFIKDKNVIR